MRRRTALRALVSVPAAAAAVPAQALAAPQAAASDSGSQQTAPIAVTEPDAVAAGTPRLFSDAQRVALRKLSATLVPPFSGYPSALEAGVPEFLEFLVSAAAGDVQSLWRQGLDSLNARSTQQYGKPFAEAGPSETAALLEPLRQPWTYDAPRDPYAAFLREAKDAMLRATRNSREWAEAARSRSRRAASAESPYWLPVE